MAEEPTNRKTSLKKSYFSLSFIQYSRLSIPNFVDVTHYITFPHSSLYPILSGQVQDRSR